METVSAWSRKSWPATPSTKTIGRKTATVVSVEAMTGPATSTVPATAASPAPSPPACRRWIASSTTIESSSSMPTPSAQSAKRHDVQREPHLLHHEEGGDHRDRNGHRDHRGRAAVPEEERDHQDGEQAALPGVPHHLRDGALDEAGLVEEHSQREPRGQRVLHCFELGADSFGDLDGVRVALLEDADLDPFGAALAQDHFLVLEAGTDLGHVAEPDEPSLGVLDDHRADAVQGVQLVQGADQVAGLVLVDAAAGEVHVVGRERVPDLRDGDAVGGGAGPRPRPPGSPAPARPRYGPRRRRPPRRGPS